MSKQNHSGDVALATNTQKLNHVTIQHVSMRTDNQHASSVRILYKDPSLSRSR